MPSLLLPLVLLVVVLVLLLLPLLLLLLVLLLLLLLVPLMLVLVLLFLLVLLLLLPRLGRKPSAQLASSLLLALLWLGASRLRAQRTLKTPPALAPPAAPPVLCPPAAPLELWLADRMSRTAGISGIAAMWVAVLLWVGALSAAKTVKTHSLALNKAAKSERMEAPHSGSRHAS
jgi:hypothetical protein